MQVPCAGPRILCKALEHKGLMLLLAHPASRLHTLRTLKTLFACILKVEEAGKPLLRAVFQFLIKLYYQSTDQPKAELANQYFVEVSH